MINGQNRNGDQQGSAGEKSQISPPTISLPKGGGAIRGVGEKFAANPVTGTGSMTVPIATSPGRSGFGPQLSLSYDSGSGNGPFGFSWNLSLPSITRKTDKGLPKYQDADESDVFILSGAEDLVPILEKKGETWEREALPPRTVGGVSGTKYEYKIQRYRPRIEGLFARIERWTNQTNPAETFWRSISKDNITTWYGRTENSRITDPTDGTRIFSWLICETYDDKGNVVVYDYKAEDSNNVDQSQAHERNRTDDSNETGKANRTANRYLKRIHYGNRHPYLPELKDNAPWPKPPGPIASDGTPNWLFEVVFDYEDGHYAETSGPDGRVFAQPIHSPPKSAKWMSRVDPFSTYRSGFEIRTYRLCQRVLMFHHFPEELGTPDYLVRSTDFTYSYENNPQDARNPIFSFLDSVSHSGYVRQSNGSYLKKALPPLLFAYTKAEVQEEVREVDPRSVENLPIGLDGATYQWVDLDGEGISGILTEQAEGWFYKRNLSPLPVQQNGKEEIAARFAPVELIAEKPSLAAVSAGRQQFLDLSGDGQLDLVDFHEPTPGFYERTPDERWEMFRPFTSLPNLEWHDPHLKFVDLTGDGHADVLMTEDDVFSWHPSLAEDGFGPAERVRQHRDEEKGPRLVFADAEHSIYLADLSGDGLTDLVRIRNGEVCYWPNLGYGRFGAKVTMDNAPWFDRPDLFDPRRMQLADIDGSGVTDIVYLGRDGVHLYFNQSGNSWSKSRHLKYFPQIENLSAVTVIDLLGNGTACLVWSSPLLGNGRRPLRYIDLMDGQKPHLLVKTINNLGAETQVDYAPSTKFYLQDKVAGKPWLTRLPFPVHCVEKVTVSDKWRKTRFSTTYSYHHGYFDGHEREFRGFGRVEQVDVESFGEFAEGNTASPYITDDKTLYQPPVKTVTWFHTGIAVDRAHILSGYAQEYFPHWFEVQDPQARNVLGNFRENSLPEPDLHTEELSPEEWREALRACKGMALRQEIYELDVDALEQGEHKPVRLFTTAYHNCHIRRLQPRAQNRHAVFLVTESEAITYHYELDLRAKDVTPDPRIAHTLNLAIDQYGNVLQSVAVVYQRLGKFEDDADLAAGLTGAIPLISRIQREEMHLAYTENRYTDDVVPKLVNGVLKNIDTYRLRAPCEILTYELTGINPDPRNNGYFTLEELRRYRLSLVHQTMGATVPEILYQQLPKRTTPEKRLVEHVRMLFFKDDPNDPAALKDSLPFGQLGQLGLPYETYKLALTENLLDAVFSDAAGNKLDKLARGTLTARQLLQDAGVSGYLSGADLVARFAPVPPVELAGQYWMRSGVAGFASDAADHFYLPERYEDPFGNVTTLAYDGKYDLFIQSSTDPRGNRTEVTQFDYRMLAPRELKDINGNFTEAYFDVLGMVVASALKGKGTEADNLAGFDDALANPSRAELDAFFNGAAYDKAAARRWLRNAGARHVYHFGEKVDGNGQVIWGDRPAGACTIQRERHVAQLAPREESPLQVAFECSDGLGAVLMKKVQAEPAPGQAGLRWIVNGKTVLNNKGKPVKQFEPYFSESGHRCEEPREVGVTPVMYYDAVGRLVRTELPDDTLSRVEFSPWHVRTFDQNDTVKETKWYTDRNPPDPDQPLPRDPVTGALLVTPNQRAAWLAAQHRDTPSLTILDSLGREVIAVAHNRVKDVNGQLQDEKYLTFTKLDTEGKPLWIRDARGNLVMQYINPPVPNNQQADPSSGFVPCYDIAGNLLFQHSMDAGDRWMLMDAAGKPMLAWDNNEFQDTGSTAARQQRIFFTEYDALHRPLRQWLTIDSGPAQLIELSVYGEDAVAPADPQRNLRGQIYRHYDSSGLSENTRFDFKGNLVEQRRRLASDAKAAVLDWQANQQAAAWDTGLESETFLLITEYDALNRMTRLYNWHRGAGSTVAVYEPRYNERGLLASEDLVVRARKTATGYDLVPRSAGVIGSQRTRAIQEIRYNAKGQKEFLKLGNGTVTRYDYDSTTFRLRQLRTGRPTYDPLFPQHRSGLRDASILQQLHYTYDPTGNITEIYDEAYEPVYFQNQRVEPRSRYEYDALYRLINATGRENGAASGPPTQFESTSFQVNFPVNAAGALRNYTQEYHFDSVGNITQMHHIAGTNGSWTRDYAYAADSNRLLRIWEGSNTTAATQYAYDTHGNMLNLANVAPAQRIRWDHRDMIHSLNLQGGGWAYYNYDAGKQRSRKRLERQGGTVEERLYLGGYELYRRYDAQQRVVEEIESHHLLEDQQRVLLVDDVLRTDNTSMTTGPLYRYQYSNQLGSACTELNHQAEVISYEEYHPYGTSAYLAMTNRIEVPPKRYRYIGKERDEESGLNYHSARYFASWFGRWISCDPAGLGDGVNLYQYSRHSPIIGSDTTGLQTTSQTNLLSQPFIASGRYGWLHSVPGYTREHIIPGSWLKYALEAKYGATATGTVAPRLYRSAWTSLLNNTLAGPKTSLDLAYAAELRALLKAGGNIDVTDFYLRAMRNLQAGSPMSSESLAHAHETAVRELVSYVKGERFARLAAQGQSVPTKLDAALQPSASSASSNSAATGKQVEVVKFPKKSTSSETSTVKVSTVESPGVKASTVESPGVKSRSAGLSLGAKANILFLIMTLVLPDETRAEFEDKNLGFWKKAASFWASLVMSKEEKEDPTRVFVEKQLKSSVEPGSGMIELMERHGYRYEGMVEGNPKWTEQSTYRRVNVGIGR